MDLGSRNFNWSLPLLSLRGRAGLDLHLALTYNSLVWTKAWFIHEVQRRLRIAGARLSSGASNFATRGSCMLRPAFTRT